MSAQPPKLIGIDAACESCGALFFPPNIADDAAIARCSALAFKYIEVEAAELAIDDLVKGWRGLRYTGLYREARVLTITPMTIGEINLRIIAIGRQSRCAKADRERTIVVNDFTRFQVYRRVKCGRLICGDCAQDPGDARHARCPLHWLTAEAEL